MPLLFFHVVKWAAHLPAIFLENHLSMMSIHTISPFPLTLVPWKPRRSILHTCPLFPFERGQMSYHPFQNHFSCHSLCQAGRGEALHVQAARPSPRSPGAHSLTRWRSLGGADGAAETTPHGGKLKGKAPSEDKVRWEGQWPSFEKA